MDTHPEQLIDINRSLLSQPYNNFLDDVIHTANANGVQIQMSDTDLVYCNSDVPCRGYFTDLPSPVLSVACDYPKEEWLTTLVHESCHMDQWLSDSPYWINAKVLGIEAISLIELWVQGYIELTEEKKWHYIRLARNLELDCERRAVSKIKKLNLPLDVTWYTQRANAYVLYYNAIGYTRKWFKPGKAPYDRPEIYTTLPKEMVISDEWYEPWYMNNDLKQALISCTY